MPTFDIELDLSLCLVVEPQARPRQNWRATLTSIYETADQLAFEVVIAEIGETGAAGLVDEFPGLMITRMAAGVSPIAAANHALRLGKGRYVALMEADVILCPQALQRLLEVMDLNPEIGLIGPRILDAYGATEASVCGFPPLLRLAGLPLPRVNGQRRQESGEIDWLRGGLCLMRRELLEDIGLLAPACGRLAPLDFAWRARRQGWHRWYLSEATAIHAHPAVYHPELGSSPPWPLRLREGLSFWRHRWREGLPLFV